MSKTFFIAKWTGAILTLVGLIMVNYNLIKGPKYEGYGYAGLVNIMVGVIILFFVFYHESEFKE
jgi:membrane protein DedA with SNARE-associated domain